MVEVLTTPSMSRESAMSSSMLGGSDASTLRPLSLRIRRCRRMVSTETERHVSTQKKDAPEPRKNGKDCIARYNLSADA